uniref:Uncharacterized protein n=1 Tax=Candidatus Kentrum sp. LPFa TaxID=2126335 RepID=A0A450X0G5_9GAMM|nr:MAG: hypothetical protein BECKLPF1236B_GA0070989_13261 [Candidatus Kentron sp. LPFa]
MILRYAENVTHSDDAALDYLGWGAHRKPARLKPPGQTRHLEAMGQNGGQGDGWIALDWKQPDEGGKAAAYKIQRREADSEIWLDAGRQPWDCRPPFPTSCAVCVWNSMSLPSIRRARANQAMGGWRCCEGGRDVNERVELTAPIL